MNVSAARLAEIEATSVAESFTTAHTARLLGLSETTVRRRRADNRLYAFPYGRQWRYAAWQFTNNSLIPGIEEVSASIPASIHPAFVRGLMLAPRPFEGKRELESPRDYLLRGGDPSRVTALFDTLRAL